MDFFDLKKQYHNLKAEIDAAVLKTLDSGVFIGGSEVENFEKEIAEFCGARHALSLNSGTDALVLSIKALGIGAGDEIIVPAFTYFATAEAVAIAGATPVFADIEKDGFNIDPDEIEKKITSKTKAIIPVHLFGQAADMDGILAIAKKHNLFVIEDAAQAVGAKYKEKFVGTIGDIGCFSLFPTKNLGVCGDGGFALTDNDDLAQRVKLLRAHGAKPEDKYTHLTLGTNSRLDAIQAAIARVKLRHLNEFNKKRISNARYYNESLDGCGVGLPTINDDGSHVFHQYTIRTARRDELVKYLKGKGVPTMVYYSTPLHLQPAFAYLGFKEGDFPVSEQAAKEVLSLPIYPELEGTQRDQITEGIRFFYGR